MTTPPPERVEAVEIQQEMADSFLEYAMSVIVSRALPDVRDGLKPVHRRILFAMFDGGMRPGTPFRKCSRVVGDVVGWFHPHDGNAVYDALARLAQDFSTRYPLVDPQGNFGTVDDRPAAMRYCVIGDTLVRTAEGTVRIDAIVPDPEPNRDHDIDLKVLDRRGDPVVASKLFHSGTHPTLRVVTREGFELTGTHNHPVLTLTPLAGVPTLVWRLLEELRPGDRVAIARPEDSLTGGDHLDPELAMLMGAWVSEGFASENRAGFNNTDPVFFGYVADAYAAFVGGPRYVYERRLASGKILYELDVQNIERFAASPLGVLMGQRSEGKAIPDAIWRADHVAKQAFLRALFEGDGSSSRLPRNTVQVSYSTRSEQLARDVQLLLLEFGVLSRIGRSRRGEVKLYIGNRRDVLRFAERVGFLDVKHEKLRRDLAGVPATSRAFSSDAIPGLAGFLRSEATGAHRQWLLEHDIDRVERWERDGEAIRSHIEAEDVAAVAEHLVDHGYFYAEVTDIVDAGEQPVYSLKVESDDHSFLANGFVNHNTEARLAPLAMHLLEGINEDTVDWMDNYSGEREEPTVLPARFPNLLVNGSTGIAVGMATNMAPHNLGEVTDAIVYAIENPGATSEDLMQFVKGPDFPTGAYIVGTKGIRDALLTGRGSIRQRAVADVVEINKRTAIVFTEIPYQVSRDRITARIAELVHAKTITGIADIRDESDRAGTRLVIELRRDAVPQVVLNQLYKNTQLEESFSVNNVALVDGVPRTLSLGDLVHHYIAHQLEVIERRTRFRLGKAYDRAHIVEGLLIALDNIDEVVAIIRGSADVDEARTTLMGRFELSDIQANHILDMPLRRLTALETDKLREEYEELQRTIEELEAILASEARRRALVAAELREVADKFADPRRSRIIPDEGDLSLEDLIADEELVVSVTAGGYIKSVLAGSYRTQGRGGRGVKGAALKEDDVISHVLHTTAHAYLLFFTNLGKVYRLKAHEVPRKDRTAKGVLVQSVLPLGPEERVEAIIDTRDYETFRYLVAFTKQGQVKKTRFSEYESRVQVLNAIRLAEGDEVVAVQATTGDNEVVMFTRDGMGIRFSESDVRPMGRDTQGVRGIKLRPGDEVVAAASMAEGDEILLLTTGGYGKRTSVSEFRPQTRGGIGVKAMKLTRVRGTLVDAKAVSRGDEIVAMSSDGIVIRQSVDSISRQKRDSTGVKVMDLAQGAVLSAVALVPRDESGASEES